MEKKIKFDNVIDFVYRALKGKYHFRLSENYMTIIREIKYTDVDGSKISYNCFDMFWYLEDNVLTIRLDDNNYYQIKVENQKDIARWNILIEDVKEYILVDIETKFNNFFEEDNSKPTTIDDLDNDEE